MAALTLLAVTFISMYTVTLLYGNHLLFKLYAMRSLPSFDGLMYYINGFFKLSTLLIIDLGVLKLFIQKQ
jgi:hypothetical protein